MFFRSFIKHCALYLYHKVKNRHLVKFCFSSYISHKCVFEGMNGVGRKSSFYGSMGLGSAIGQNCSISADIARFTSMGSGIKQIPETHAYKYPFATTSPRFYSLNQEHTFAKQQMFDEYRFYDKEREIAFKVGNDCWIGNDVTFIGGIQVADGAVVLAKAVVTKDVPPYAIVGGVPAKVIGYRYDEETIGFLLHIKWWENDEQWFKENWQLMNDIDKLRVYYKDRLKV